LLKNKDLGDVCADSAFGHEKSFEAIVTRGGTPFIPPRRGTCKTKKPSLGMAHRNHNVEACWKVGRDYWKTGTVYHHNSLAETAMYRFKTILESKLSSRKFENEVNAKSLLPLGARTLFV
jgi:hypothetical protein